MKLKPTLKQKVTENRKRHNRILRQYGIDDKKTVVVERSNTVKFLVKAAVRLVRILISILVFALSCIGLTALLYPSIRQCLIYELSQLIQQVTCLLNL